MSESLLPVAKLHIGDIERANEEILAYAETLVAMGERPWFEVYYPAPAHLTEEEAAQWHADQEYENGGTFDAVEVINGEILTLPPYSVLEARDN